MGNLKQLGNIIKQKRGNINSGYSKSSARPSQSWHTKTYWPSWAI